MGSNSSSDDSDDDDELPAKKCGTRGHHQWRRGQSMESASLLNV